MRYVFVILFLLLSGIGHSQISNSVNVFPTHGDTICVPKSVIIQAGNKIKAQQDTIRNQRSIIVELNNQRQLQEKLLQKQTDELTLLYSRVEITDGILDRYQKYIRKQQWHEKEWIYIATGFFGALTVSVIVNNIK
jgi:high-affinity Fe2+/Pb2+ permease